MPVEKIRAALHRLAIEQESRDVAEAAHQVQLVRHAGLIERDLVVGRLIERHQQIPGAVIEKCRRIIGRDVGCGRGFSERGRAFAPALAEELRYQRAAVEFPQVGRVVVRVDKPNIFPDCRTVGVEIEGRRAAAEATA